MIKINIHFANLMTDSDSFRAAKIHRMNRSQNVGAQGMGSLITAGFFRSKNTGTRKYINIFPHMLNLGIKVYYCMLVFSQMLGSKNLGSRT